MSAGRSGCSFAFACVQGVQLHRVSVESHTCLHVCDFIVVNQPVDRCSFSVKPVWAHKWVFYENSFRVFTAF
eukprot:m.309300 g.309300  ORF g.309300 m.309300 type:complete len:72 (+) comp15945_c5_seq2:148-363(+)